MHDRGLGDHGARRAQPDTQPGGSTDHDTDRFRDAVSGVGRSALRPGESRTDGELSASGQPVGDPGALSGGGQRASGTGGPDGGDVGSPGRGATVDGPRFDQPVPAGGYLWWYVDGVSDCGRYGLSLIAFVGSVFSPYYYWAGRKDPENHVCMNVALYNPRGSRWSMTERGRKALSRSQTSLTIGPSSARWEDGALTLDLAERAVPHLSRISGTVRLVPEIRTSVDHELAPRHRWWPIAPRARISVDLSAPDLSWEGSGYFDCNWGDEPIEDGFQRWDWLRADLPDGEAAVLYAGSRRDGQPFGFGLRFAPDGTASPIDAPPARQLGRGLWQVTRTAPAEAGANPRVIRVMEDSPFYLRSELRTRIEGHDVHAVGETLDLDRFRSRIVKLMLPWRMPRITF